MIAKTEEMLVLVVDDNPDNVELVEQVLSDDYQTITADNGYKCIELAKSQQPDAILLDVMMPQMDGYAVLKELLADELTKDIPVIFLTARYKDIDRIVKGLALGAFDYITKPFDDEILLARVGVALRVKYAEDELRKQKKLLETQVGELASAQNVIQRTNVELAAKNKELESFSYSVSHDLRSPLRSIAGFSQVLLEDCGDEFDGEAKQHLHRIVSGVKHMDSLINGLLQLSNMTRAKMNVQSMNLSRLATETGERLSQSSPERDVVFRINDEVSVSADVNLIRSVMENLLDNAWKYTKKTSNPVVEFGVIQNQEEEQYYIRDNGIGFDPVHTEKLFGAFQRLHNDDDYPGTGIGLATVQRIIHRHGGRVWAEAEPDKGATFFFTIARYH